MMFWGSAPTVTWLETTCDFSWWQSRRFCLLITFTNEMLTFSWRVVKTKEYYFSVWIHRSPEFYPWAPDSTLLVIVTPGSQPPILAPQSHQESTFVFHSTGNSVNSGVHDPWIKKNQDNVDWLRCHSCRPCPSRKSRRSLRTLLNTAGSQTRRLGCTHLSQTQLLITVPITVPQIFPKDILGAT